MLMVRGLDWEEVNHGVSDMPPNAAMLLQNSNRHAVQWRTTQGLSAHLKVDDSMCCVAGTCRQYVGQEVLKTLPVEWWDDGR